MARYDKIDFSLSNTPGWGDRTEPTFLPGSAPQVSRDFFRDCVELAASKDAAYGGAWERQGYMGNLARIQSKVERLRTMFWHDRTPENIEAFEESAADTLKDLANLCAFAAANMQKENRWG